MIIAYILITPLFTESFCKELCNIGDELKNKFNYWHQSNVAKDSTLYFNIMRSRYFAGEKFFEDFTSYKLYLFIRYNMVRKFNWMG